MRKRTKLIVATAASGALALGAPTVAYADDVIGVGNDNNVAANVCDTNVNAILAAQEDNDKTNCKNNIRDKNGNDEGDSLVGVLNDNNIAANVCDTNVNAVLAEQQTKDKTNCKNNINANKGHKKKHRQAPKKEKAPQAKPVEKQAPQAEEVAPQEAAPAPAQEVSPSFAG